MNPKQFIYDMSVCFISALITLILIINPFLIRTVELLEDKQYALATSLFIMFIALILTIVLNILLRFIIKKFFPSFVNNLKY